MNENRNFKIYYLLSIVLFLMILITPSFLWGMGKLMPHTQFEQLDYDLGENRNKAPFPEKFSSAYGTEIETYYNDRLPFRSIIISANRKMTSFIETPYNKNISPFLVKLFYNTPAKESENTLQADASLPDVSPEFIPNETEPEHTLPTDALPKNTLSETIPAAPSETPSETTTSEPPVTPSETVSAENNPTSYVPPKVLNNTTILGQNGWLFLAVENALDDYLGSNILNDAEMDTYVKKMVQLQNLCTLKGKKLYYITLPNKAQVYSEQMPSYTIIDNYKRTQRLTDYVKAHSDIKIIYPLDEMIASKNLLQLYFKTDTHWNETGAFVGVQALLSLMEMPVTDIQSVPFSSHKFANGDLVRLGNLNAEDYEDVGYSFVYKPEIQVTSLDGTVVDDPIYKSASTSANQYNVVLVGDSYRVFMANYLSKDFSNYTHIHRDNLSDPVAINALQNADIIVIESVERVSHTLLTTSEQLCDILK